MDELKNIAPELSKLKKEPPFKVPDYYFDDFSARLQMQIQAEKSAVAPRKTRFIQIFKPALGLAASFALIFLLVYVPLKTFFPNQENTVAEVSASEDLSLMNVIEHLDESSFISLLDDKDKSAEFSDEDLTMYVSANFNDYEIFENLDNQ